MGKEGTESEGFIRGLAIKMDRWVQMTDVGGWGGRR